MSINSRTLSPLRCKKHKDYNPEHVCGGKKCVFDSEIMTVYSPYDYIYDHKNKRFIKSNIRYLIKWEINF